MYRSIRNVTITPPGIWTFEILGGQIPHPFAKMVVQMPLFQVGFGGQMPHSLGDLRSSEIISVYQRCKQLLPFSKLSNTAV